MNKVLAFLLVCPVTYAKEQLFKTNNHYPLVSEVIHVEVGDIDGDGIPEVLLATTNKQGLIILQVNEDGQLKHSFKTPQVAAFQKPASSSVINQSVKLFDVDNDQDLDLWLSTPGNSFESQLLINDGNGNFLTSGVIAEEFSRIENVELLPADVDKDGDMDLVLGFDGFEGPPGYDLFINNGSQGFSRQTSRFYAHDEFAYSHLADFNQDGFVDLWRAGDNLHIYLNDQTGGFNQQPLVFAMGFWDKSLDNNYPNIVFKDINMDGHLDIQAFSNLQTLPRAINNGDGSFSIQPFTPYDQEASQQTGVFVDVNGDQVLDLWVSSADTQHSYLVLSDTQGFIDHDSQVDFAESFVSSAHALDFNLDGKSDVLSVGQSQLNLWQQTVIQSFSQVEQTTENDRWGAVKKMRWQDINNDGYSDLIQLNGQQVKYRLGDGRTTLGALQTTEVMGSNALQVVDFNGDGHMDLLTSLGADVLLSLRGDDGGFVTSKIQPTNEVILNLEVADFDGDGDIDFLVRLASFSSGIGHTHIYQNDGLASFTLKQVLPHKTEHVQFMDLNQDGQYSVVLISTGDNPGIAEGLYEYEYTQSGVFELKKQLTLTDEFRRVFAVFAVDDDGDGDLDILLSQAQFQERTKLVINQGDSFVLKDHNFPFENFLVAVADFNNDGFEDYLASEPAAVMINNQGGGFEVLALEMESNNGLVADIDNDGDLDLILSDPQNGQNTLINTTLDQDFNGLWFNPEENGHGIQSQEIIVNGTPHVLASWYVYEQGAPLWLIGTGPITGNTATLQVYITDGPQFGADYDVSDYREQLWGTLTMTLTERFEMHLQWNGSEFGFNQGEMVLDRLSAIKAVEVGGIGLNSCHSGNWYNADENGHGYMVQVVEIGGVDSMVLTWFTYQQGQQFWITSTGALDGNKATLQAYSGTGGQFPPNFVSQDVITEDWGNIVFELIDDNHATITWNPIQPGFASGQLMVSRLTSIDRYRCL